MSQRQVLDVEDDAPKEPGDFRQKLLVNPRSKPNIQKVDGNAALLHRLQAFLPALKESNENLQVDTEKRDARVELPDSHRGKHIELDLACGVFDLMDQDAVQAAEQNMLAGRISTETSSGKSDSDSTCDGQDNDEQENACLHPGIQEM